MGDNNESLTPDTPIKSEVAHLVEAVTPTHMPIRGIGDLIQNYRREQIITFS